MTKFFMLLLFTLGVSLNTLADNTKQKLYVGVLTLKFNNESPGYPKVEKHNITVLRDNNLFIVKYADKADQFVVRADGSIWLDNENIGQCTELNCRIVYHEHSFGYWLTRLTVDISEQSIRFNGSSQFTFDGGLDILINTPQNMRSGVEYSGLAELVLQEK